MTRPDPAAAAAAPAIARRGRTERRNRRRLAWAAVGGGAALASALLSPGVTGALGAALALIMLRIALEDCRRFVVPDALSGGAFLLGLVEAAVAGDGLDAALAALGGAALGGGLLLVVRLAYQAIRGREGLGLGDVKLAAAAGAWLTPPMFAAAIEIAAVAGLGAHFWRQSRRARALRATARIPFGAFFAPAIWLCWLLDAARAALN